MGRKTLWRVSVALGMAVALSGTGAPGGLAQESQGSTVTTGDGTSGVDAGGVLIVAPGVTIDGGDVTNDTGIGVVVGGGSSVGATGGGDDNLSADD